MLELGLTSTVEEIPNHIFNVGQINSIQKKYPKLRQKSKAPTFALTFAGTSHTLVSNCGFSQEEAKEIEAKYHALYAVSDAWVQSQIMQAHVSGYSYGAFGLRIRAPLLEQVVYGAANMPFAASAESRTLGNAISGQSYGLLNNRAAVDFMQKVWASKYRLDIKPVALIQDAAYLIIKDDIEVVEWANRELINSMAWQDLPELRHDTVKINSALDLFWPDWSHATTLPNNADQETIRNLCDKTKKEYL